MTFDETAIAGVWIIDADVFRDSRGEFVRAWMPDEFRARGLETRVAQCSIASNELRGTIRGLHYQAAPFEEAKLVRAVQGTVYDVAVDVREGSPTYRRWVGVELTAASRRMLYLPPGIAHGYQTLTDGAEVLYFVSSPYSPQHQRGIRWDDPALGIGWPLGAPTRISERDAGFPDLG